MRGLALLLLFTACASSREEPKDPLERAIRNAYARRKQHIEDAERIDASLVKVRHDLPRVHGEDRTRLHRKLAKARAEIDEHKRLATVELNVAEQLKRHRGQQLTAAEVEAVFDELWTAENKRSKELKADS